VGDAIHYDGRMIGIRYSRGKAVPYVDSWEDNVLRPPDLNEWPESLQRQVQSYVASSSWFAEADAAALASRLGRISKFQSLNSEDAVTWSWFGTLGLAEAESRRRAVQWLYDRLGLGLQASPEVRIDQWMRVFHPNAPESPNGPELDARIDDPEVALTYVEAKWHAELGTGKGSAEDRRDDQVVLRRDSLRADPNLAGDNREFVVLGISNSKPDLRMYDEIPDEPPLRPVQISWLTWSELAECEAHPLAAEFRRYLEWKRELARTLAT
jgi:hypothetical protein